MVRQYTVEEAAIILMVADAIEKERLNVNAPTFTTRTLALASGAPAHELGYLLDWLGVLSESLHNYRRPTAKLLEVIEAQVSAAEAVLDSHAEDLGRPRTDGGNAPLGRPAVAPTLLPLSSSETPGSFPPAAGGFLYRTLQKQPSEPACLSFCVSVYVQKRVDRLPPALIRS